MRVRSCTGTGRCAAHPEIPLKDTGARRADTGKSDTRPGTDGTVFSKKTQKKRRKNCPEKQLPGTEQEMQRDLLCRAGGHESGKRLNPENGLKRNISPEDVELFLRGQYTGNGIAALRRKCVREKSLRLLNKMRGENRETGKQNNEKQRCANHRLPFCCSDPSGHAATLLRSCNIRRIPRNANGEIVPGLLSGRMRIKADAQKFAMPGPSFEDKPSSASGIVIPMQQTVRPGVAFHPAFASAPHIDPHREIPAAETVEHLHRNPDCQDAVLPDIFQRRNLPENEGIQSRRSVRGKVDAQRRPETARLNLQNK